MYMLPNLATAKVRPVQIVGTFFFVQNQFVQPHGEILVLVPKFHGTWHSSVISAPPLHRDNPLAFVPKVAGAHEPS